MRKIAHTIASPIDATTNVIDAAINATLSVEPRDEAAPDRDETGRSRRDDAGIEGGPTLGAAAGGPGCAVNPLGNATGAAAIVGTDGSTGPDARAGGGSAA